MEHEEILKRLNEVYKERDELFNALSKISIEELVSEIENDFDNNYITSSELCLFIGIDRAVLITGGKRGGKLGPKLPGSVSLLHGNLTIWNRAFIMPYAEKWKAELELRRTPKHLRNNE